MIALKKKLASGDVILLCSDGLTNMVERRADSTDYKDRKKPAEGC